MTAEEFATLLDTKLRESEARLEQKLEEKLEQKLEEKLQPLWAAVGGLTSRINVVEEKIDAVAKDVQQIKYDASKLRGRLNRVDLEELRADVDAIKETLGITLTRATVRWADGTGGMTD